jgi:hypothetical protein
MMRRETFGTTGPQIKLRFFAGWDFTVDDVTSADFVDRGYTRGVAMGGTLRAKARAGAEAPVFMAWAAKDASSANLDRLQLIKGWQDAKGRQHEKIYNLSWSGERQLDAKGKLAPVGNTVDASAATYENSIGVAELAAVWSDPEFDPDLHAFYYVRVLEIPTPRWSTYDAVGLGIEIPGGLPASIQERAFSSPIWYRPAITSAPAGGR